MNYTITISEEQRALLEASLKTQAKGVAYIGTRKQYDEVEMLRIMLVDLPKDEAETPDVIHDFTA